MRRRAIVIVAGLAGIAALAVVIAMRTPDVREAEPVAVPSVPSASAPTPQAPAPATPRADPPVATPTNIPPDWWIPSRDLQANLDAANAGDADAMLSLGRALRNCVPHMADPTGSKLLEEHDRAIASLMDARTTRKANADVARRNIDDRFARSKAIHADCLAIGAERIRTGLAWIERAARAGNPAAKLEYARDAFSEFGDGKAQLADLDEVIRRRDLARAWAMQALEAGERGAVDLLARAHYGESPLFPRDLRQGAPYSIAQEMIMARYTNPEEFRRLYDHGPPRERYAWGNDNAWVHDDAAWQEALDRARRIIDRIPPPPPR